MGSLSGKSSAGGQNSLIFAIRLRVVFKYLFELLGLLGVLALIPMSVAFGSGQSDVGFAYLTISTICGGLYVLSRRLEGGQQLQRNETLAVAALVFICSSLLLTLPMLQYSLPFVDAWFEAVSGVTTTGLSTLQSVEDKPIAFLFGRGWMQWVGGLGVIVLALAIHTQPGIESKLFGADAAEVDDHIGGTRAHAKRILVVYVILTTIGITGLILAGGSLIDSIVHAMTAISTGGFSNYDDSFAGASTAERWIVSVVCILGAVSLHLYYRPAISSLWSSLHDTQFRFLLSLVAITPLGVFGLARLQGNSVAIDDAYFNTVSAITTAGFSTSSVLPFGAAGMVLICLCMFIGGGMGSTAGGIKLYRFMLLVKTMLMFARRASSGVRSQIILRLDGERIGHETIENVLAVLAGYLFFLVCGWLIFLAFGEPPIASLYEVTSALSTSGVSAGLTTSELATPLKLVLIANMLLGRVETVAIVILFFPRTWFGKKRK